jgi:hypothetical protein
MKEWVRARGPHHTARNLCPLQALQAADNNGAIVLLTFNSSIELKAALIIIYYKSEV